MAEKISNYDGHYAFESEGGRIGVSTCFRCGVAIIIPPIHDVSFSPRVVHDKWHEENDKN